MLEYADKVIDGIKKLREIAKKIESAELQGQIADLMLASADMKLEMADLKSEMFKVQEENARLKRKADIRGNIEMRGNHIFLTNPMPGYNQGPFCPICFETNEILVNIWESMTGWHCPHCGKNPG